jgi:hypothetical protein
MNVDARKDLQNPPAPRDFELDAEELGPSSRMMCIEADPEGGIFYQFGRRQPRCLQFPSAFGLRVLGMIDQNNLAAFFDLETNALQALAAYSAVGTRIILFGEDWGAWLDEDGRRHASGDIVPLLRQWRVPVSIQDNKSHLMFDFAINIYARDLFQSDMRTFFREDRDLRHSVSLIFSYPSGEFVTSRLVVHERATGKLRYIYDIDRFPLFWPGRKVSLTDASSSGDPPARPAPSRPVEAAAGETSTATSAAGSGAAPEAPPAAEEPPQARPTGPKRPSESAAAGLNGDGRAAGHGRGAGRRHEAREETREETREEARPGGPAKRRRQNVPETTHLSSHELIAILSTEEDPDRRWQMIEPNLSMGRPERTYALIRTYTDTIAERVCGWSPIRLKTVFADQPGAVMIGLMNQWKNNQILAIADANAESDHIVNWLREREIERLMQLDVTLEIRTVNAARGILNIDTNVDAAVVKRVWRTLLGFVNVDHGRASERAIHRKRDEVAKHLHEARDVLMQKMD